MPQKRLVDIPAVFAQCLNRPLHINRIPKDNSADDEIESACTVALILVTAIAEFTEPVQEDGTSQRVLSLALIQTNLHAATQFDVCKIATTIEIVFWPSGFGLYLRVMFAYFISN